MNVEKSRSPWAFFGLVFLLSIPFWAAGALTSRQLLPALPISALGFIVPVLAAAILVYRQEGRAGVTALLRRALDVHRIAHKVWLIPLFLLEPLIKTAAYLIQRLAGTPVPAPQIAPVYALALLGGFFIAALGEELGWSGYAIDPLQERFGALRASLIIGVVWAVWHFIPLAQAQRSAGFIAWWSLETVALRVIITWFYNHAGRSVFVAAIYHAMVNLTWQLYPVSGSFYDPRVTGLVTALAAVLLVILWPARPDALARKEDY